MSCQNLPDAILTIESGIGSPDRFLLGSRASPFIGRSPACDVVIEMPAVSRRHAWISYHDATFFVTDLGSHNGTYVNGKRLRPREEQALTDGDRVGLAGDQVSLRFHRSWEFITASLGRAALHTDLRVDAISRLVWVKGNEVTPPFSIEEFNLLNALYEKRGRAVSNRELAFGLSIQLPNGDDMDEAIKRYICHIRLKLEQTPSHPSLIVTLPGYGYILVGPNENSGSRATSANP